MAPVRGIRSAHDAVVWECKAKGHQNLPKECLLFDIPTMQCGCGCGEKFNDDFEFCIGDIEINGHEVLGEPMNQKVGGHCVAFAYAKTVEISRRMKEILQGRDPSLVPIMKALDLVAKYEKLIGECSSSGIKKVVHMAQILKDQGIISKDLKTIYKVSDVSTIKRNDPEAIALELANGFPLHAGLLVGKKLRILKCCRQYKPPRRARFFEKKKNVSGHAVVLVGAGRKAGKWFFFFLNSWKRFCVRLDPSGKVKRYGIGKIKADRLSRNVVRLSRFRDPGGARSLERQDGTEISAHNLRLLKSRD
uniref:Peptidase C1A papain C-terminal domain-containing protein n=1 Tax=Arundo donax TaxID=35708 RepID=A0A0A9AC13_ARUDO